MNKKTKIKRNTKGRRDLKEKRNYQNGNPKITKKKKGKEETGKKDK